MLNRRQRREEKFGKTPEPPKPPSPAPPTKLLDTKDTVLLGLAVVMWLIPLPSGGEAATLCIRMGLVAIVLTHPVLQMPWIVRAKSHVRRTIFAALSIATLFALAGVYTWRMWPHAHRHSLSKTEREKFEKPLKQLKQPQMSVHLYCAPNDEVDCVYAADLIPLFGEAGWDVSGTVERITLGRPKPGIVIGLHGTVKPEDEPTLKWNEGEWTKWTPEEEHVRQAFVNVGIEPDSASGYVIPENQINIYVGHEREDESDPTDMTRMAENIERGKREHPETLKRQGAK